MQAALFRLQGLENKFESESTSVDCSQDLEWKKCEALPSYEYVKEQLSAIKTELNSCQGCIEEAEVRVDRKYGINNSEINPTLEHLNVSVVQKENTSPEVAKKATIVLYDMEEPVVEDEVFEAFIDKEFCDRQREDSDDDFWNTDVRKERRMLKQQKEQGKRVLNELQPILMKRRKMWEQREDIALNRQLAKQGVNVDIPQTTEQKHMGPSLKREQALENLSKDIYDDKLDICGQDRMEIQKKNTSSFENISESHSNSPTLKILSTSDSPEEEEVEDSDEERLEVYRKLKMELDKDEMNRLQEDAEKDRKFQEEGECVFSLPVSHEISLRTNNHFEQTYDSEMQHYQDDVEDIGNRVCNMDVNPLSSFKCTAVKYDTVVGDLPKEGASASVRDEVDKVSDSEQILSVSELDKEVQIVKEEVFVHNEEASEEKSPRIDWNITFPVRQIETLGDRMQLFSAGQNIGFQAGIADEAQAVKYDTVVGDLPKERASASIRDEVDKISDSEQILSVSELDKEVQIVKEEVFVHNEEAGEEKSPHIDWNITFPVRQIETLGDRMQLFSAGQNIGFQAGIAAEAQAASKRFWKTASNSTEIFGGVGEGEEILGSDDSDAGEVK
ncbi:uncharacterized protein [Panulirus ornatus]|uniref:uncharacterized protein isoform X2 n=1 Tax=Panulirus ornatus TaxID=150431 RepID=UPI003A8BE84D